MSYLFLYCAILFIASISFIAFTRKAALKYKILDIPYTDIMAHGNILTWKNHYLTTKKLQVIWILYNRVYNR